MKLTQNDPARLAGFREAKAYFSNGEFFRSYDLAKEGLERWPDELAFAHLAVLSLANAGATEMALKKFEDFGLEQHEAPELRALLARLKKDLGFASQGQQRLALHAEAQAIYEGNYRRAETAGELAEAYYPGINASALAVWTGDRAGAARLAGKVLTILEELKREDRADDRYWRLATEVEANLILGELDAVERLVPEVWRLGVPDFAQIATTERQLRRLAAALGLSEELLRGLKQPAVAHYTGHIMAKPGVQGRLVEEEEPAVRAEIERIIRTERIGSGYGSLAAGADILFAEELLRQGGALHVVLPFTMEDFITHSVEPSGGNWVERFHACLTRANSVQYATEDRYLQHDCLFQYCSQLAMGLALLAARHMMAPVMQCVVWDGEARSGIAGTVVDIKDWRRTGLPQHVIRCGSRVGEENLSAYVAPEAPPMNRCRSIRTMLFGDFHGFSKLTDTELPCFAENIMGPVSEVLRGFAEKTAFVNTWGDGIFVVLDDVHEAAALALALQERMRGVDLAEAGLPPGLRLRLGGHLGPVYQLTDPVLARPNFYGAHVSRAARIEPVTPEGCVYVTETFAAILALRDATDFACDYAGYTEMAKHYGRLRIFLLRRVSGETGPTVLGDIERAPIA